MLVVHRARRPSKILQDRYVANLMARRRMSFFICYINLKTRLSFKENMKSGAHLMEPRPAGVAGGSVGEFIFLLDRNSVGNENTFPASNLT